MQAVDVDVPSRGDRSIVGGEDTLHALWRERRLELGSAVGLLHEREDTPRAAKPMEDLRARSEGWEQSVDRCRLKSEGWW